MGRYIDNMGGAVWIELCAILPGMSIPELYFLDMYNGQLNGPALDTYLPYRLRLRCIQETTAWSWKSEVVNGGLHYSYIINGLVAYQSADYTDMFDKAVRLGALVKVRTLNQQTLVFGTHKNPLQVSNLGDGGQKASDLNSFKIECIGGGMFPPIYLPY